MSNDMKATRRLKRRIYEWMGNSKYSKPSLSGLDDKLAKYLDFKGGFFIEAGANDGYSQSNTYYLERIKGWRGVLVEGVPELYEKCKHLRHKSKVYNCALVADDFTEPVVEMHFAHLMSVVDGARRDADAQAKHIGDGVRVQNLGGTYSVKVPARTLASILDTLPQPVSIDLLSLDVEGYELNVLKGLNLKKYKPKHILVEATFFDEVNDYLSADYEMVEKMSHHDYFYRLK